MFEPMTGEEIRIREARKERSLFEVGHDWSEVRANSRQASQLAGSDFGDRSLPVEVPSISGSWNFADLLNDQLADSHTFYQHDRQRPEVPDLEAQLSAVLCRVLCVRIVTEPRMDRGRGNVDAEAHAPKAALSFNSRAEPGGVW